MRKVDGVLNDVVVLDHEVLRLDAHHTLLDASQEAAGSELLPHYIVEPLPVEHVTNFFEAHAVRLEVRVQLSRLLAFQFAQDLPQL